MYIDPAALADWKQTCRAYIKGIQSVGGELDFKERQSASWWTREAMARATAAYSMETFRARKENLDHQRIEAALHMGNNLLKTLAEGGYLDPGWRAFLDPEKGFVLGVPATAIPVTGELRTENSDNGELQASMLRFAGPVHGVI